MPDLLPSRRSARSGSPERATAGRRRQDRLYVTLTSNNCQCRGDYAIRGALVDRQAAERWLGLAQTLVTVEVRSSLPRTRTPQRLRNERLAGPCGRSPRSNWFARRPPHRPAPLPPYNLARAVPRRPRLRHVADDGPGAGALVRRSLLAPPFRWRRRNRRDRARSHLDEMSALSKGAVRSRDHPVSGAANETRTEAVLRNANGST